MIGKLGLAAALFATSAAPQPALRYAVLGATPGPVGSFDYVSVDAPSGRVYVGRSFGVEVLSKGRFTTLLERKGVAAVLPIGDRLMLSTNGGENSATLFDRFTGKVTADIPTGTEPDGAAFDGKSGLAFVMNGGSEDVTLIDVARAKAVGRIAVGGAPEGGVADGAGRFFLNIEDRNEIAVISIAKRMLVRRYALAGCIEPTGIAYDAKAGLLISACHNGVAKLVDAATGRDRGTIRIGKGADGSLFDARRRIGFVPCIDGSLTVYRLDATGKVTGVQHLKTRDGARTAAYDSRRDRLYAARATVERDAKGRYLRAVRDFEIVTIGPR